MAEPIQRDVTIDGATVIVRAEPQADGSWRATAADGGAGLGDAIAHLGMTPLRQLGGDWTEAAASGEAAVEALIVRVRRAVTDAVAEAKRAQLEDANRRHQERIRRKRPPG